jgi:hypothetical protein
LIINENYVLAVKVGNIDDLLDKANRTKAQVLEESKQLEGQCFMRRLKHFSDLMMRFFILGLQKRLWINFRKIWRFFVVAKNYMVK